MTNHTANPRGEPALEKTEPVPAARKIWLCRPASMDIGRMESLKPKSRQKLLWLIHRLTGLLEMFHDQEWVQLYSQMLKRILGRNYKQVISDAVRLGYVEAKDSYKPGKRNKSYRLAGGIDGDKKVAWTECTDAVIKGNIRQEGIRKSKEAKLRIASNDVDAWLWESLIDVGLRHEPEGPVCEAVQSLLSGTPDYKVDRYGRRHTPLTRMPKAVRASVFFKTSPLSPLVEIDIKNSQPLFLLSELMDRTQESHIRHRTDTTQKCSTYTEPEQEDNTEDNKEATSRPPAATPLCGTLSRFKQDIEDGVLYDRLMGELGITDRQYFKNGLFFKYVLYCKVGKWTEDIPVVRVFDKLYPGVWQMIKAAKAGDHRELARRMQRREADFMFNKVLPRMMAKHPTARIVTIHDAVYCEERHKHDLIDIMNEEFARLGVQTSPRVTPLAELLEKMRQATKTTAAPAEPTGTPSTRRKRRRTASLRRQRVTAPAAPVKVIPYPFPGYPRPERPLPCSPATFEMLLDNGIDARDCGGDWLGAFERMLDQTMPVWPKSR